MAEDSLGAIEKALQGGEEYVVTFTGRSQYSSDGGGVSACGLAALNCTRLVLQHDQQGLRGLELLREITKRETFEDILSICTNWANTAHLLVDVDDISNAPIFAMSLTCMWTDYGKSGLQQLQDLLTRLQQTERTAAALVITRPPEIISVFKTVINNGPIFMTFDSHPRQKHPDGAALIIHPSLEAAASYLSDLLRFDPALLTDPTLHWQAQLLAHYSAHMFVAKDVPPAPADLTNTLIEASLTVLALKAEVADLNGKIKTLESDNKHLAEDNAQLEARVEDLEEDVQRRVWRARFLDTPQTNANRASTDTDGSSSTLASSHSEPPVASSSKTKIISTILDTEEDDESFATRIQLEWQEQVEPGVMLAYQRQREFEEEDRQLRAQFDTLRQTMPATFQCGICLEEELEDTLARMNGCGHSFCRSCALSYLRSKLEEHRFPIPCPICSTEQGGADPGIIDEFLAQNLGLTEAEYAVFTELQLAAFSVQLQCRKCRKSAYVDREEYDAEETIACPLPGCNYVWCKACSREIEVGGLPHSCDGTSELNHLMEEQGWKHCPGCRTPTSKIEGCNHMTCISPGCNTHFCYRCGEIIVQSVIRNEIRRALSNHYSRCHMLDDTVAIHAGSYMRKELS
ncbi:hypothetical protein NM688_g2287 [Phlebia brevispora]|uniref:Uncharacterized protein n=1 Tax=Phlebia brevispora TaxID=194682 RepID=A0ACC1T979_9APHY|nr:hypothetical protein NM688_g2287 [Phlebia brevispora]